jgi:hypothetical protein
MAREPEELELDGDITIVSTPLKYEKAEDLLPEMIGLGGLAFTHANSALDGLMASIGGGSLKKLDVARMATAFGPLMSALSDRLAVGKLKQLAPLILASTSIVYPDDKGAKVNRDLSKKEDRAHAFEEHPELYFIALGYAAKVTFAKYFPAIGPLVSKLKSLMMKDPSHPTEVTES